MGGNFCPFFVVQKVEGRDRLDTFFLLQIDRVQKFENFRYYIIITRFPNLCHFMILIRPNIHQVLCFLKLEINGVGRFEKFY